MVEALTFKLSKDSIVPQTSKFMSFWGWPFDGKTYARHRASRTYDFVIVK